MKKASRDLLAEWRELNSAHARVLHALDRALEREHRVSACELDVLQRLRDGARSIRIQDLSEQVLRSQSALSRMVGRLEGEGLVSRVVDPSDRRAVVVELTDAGRRRIGEAEQTQRRVLAEALPAVGR